MANTAGPDLEDSRVDAVRRQVRLAALLWAAEVADLTPIPVQRLHTLVYLSDVLAPVWNIDPLDGKLLKQAAGPFYPSVQADLDHLVGTGMVRISQLGYTDLGRDRWRLQGAYELRKEASGPFLSTLSNSPAGRYLAKYLRELAFAVSALDLSDMDRASSEDATYANPVISDGNVIDFGEWSHANYSVNAARALGELAPAGYRSTLGEDLHLYVQHLLGRLHGA